MDEEVKGQPAEIKKGLSLCFLIPLALLPMYGVLGWFDRSTELTPSHDVMLQSCFLIGGLAGLALAAFSIHKSKGMSVWRRIGVACGVFGAGFLAVFLVSSRSANLIEGRIDFPPAKTRTYPGLLIIWRAYQTHGKGQSWDIQTAPIWSNLDVTETDYRFMLTHRGPDDHGRNSDEISSHGFFCAKVTLQQSGEAIRILNAGSQALPAGTVVVCPEKLDTLPTS